MGKACGGTIINQRNPPFAQASDRRTLKGPVRFRHLADDQLFVVWFLRAFVTESEDDAANALCGAAS